MNCFDVLNKTRGDYIWLSGVEYEGLGLIYYYNDGQLYEKCYWEDGNKHGNCVVYHDNGQLSIISIYTNGSVKDYIQYDIDGNRVE